MSHTRSPVKSVYNFVQARRSASLGLSDGLGRTASGGGPATSRRRLSGTSLERSGPSAGKPLPPENDTAEARGGGAARPNGSGSSSGSGGGSGGGGSARH